MKSIWFSIILILVISKLSFSQEDRWIKFDESDLFNIFYDSKSIIINDNKIAVWEKIIPKNTMKDKKGEIKSAIYRLEFDCSHMSYVILFGEWRYENRFSDKLDIDYAVVYIKPDTSREKLFNILCAQ